MSRRDWLCGCGTGELAVPVSDIPDNCPTCGAEIPKPDPDDLPLEDDDE